MTDRDELRARIADVLESFAGSDLNEQAQAIIDELGLTVEPHCEECTFANIQGEYFTLQNWERR